MEISQEQNQSNIQVQSYIDGVIKVNGQNYTDILILTPEKLEKSNALKSIIDLSIDDLKQLNFDDYEVVLIGTGKNLTFPSWKLIEEAQMLGTPLEIMATDAACRTFTVLASEGRKILTVLYP